MTDAYLTDRDVIELLGAGEHCRSCLVWQSNFGHLVGAPACNALTIDPQGTMHAGDAITGETLCGLNGNAWRWIVPTAAGRQLDQGAP